MKKSNSQSDTMKAAYVVAAATILAAIIGGIFLLRSISANQSSASPTPPPVPITSATTQSTNLATTPTPTPQVISINQTMSCTNCTARYSFSLIVRSATIDPAKSQVTLLIGLQNNTTSTYPEGFRFLKLQDLQTGLTTDGAGDGFINTQITANQLELFRPTFPFIPEAGHEYSFSAGLYLGWAFSPIIIKF